THGQPLRARAIPRSGRRPATGPLPPTLPSQPARSSRNLVERRSLGLSVTEPVLPGQVTRRCHPWTNSRPCFLLFRGTSTYRNAHHHRRVSLGLARLVWAAWRCGRSVRRDSAGGLATHHDRDRLTAADCGESVTIMTADVPAQPESAIRPGASPSRCNQGVRSSGSASTALLSARPPAALCTETSGG